MIHILQICTICVACLVTVMCIAFSCMSSTTTMAAPVHSSCTLAIAAPLACSTEVKPGLSITPPICPAPSPNHPKPSTLHSHRSQAHCLSPACWLSRCKACSEHGPTQAFVQHLLDYAQPRPPAMAVIALHLCRVWAAAPEAACSFTPSLRRLLLYDTDVSPCPW